MRELQRLMVSGGAHRGRKLVTPAVYMRPMMSRVREALFSILVRLCLYYYNIVLRTQPSTFRSFDSTPWLWSPHLYHSPMMSRVREALFSILVRPPLRYFTPPVFCPSGILPLR